MKPDIRYPIGCLFSLIGLMLVAQGLLAGGSPTARAGGVNVDLWWGLVMLTFGGSMLALAHRRARREGGPRAR